MNNDETKKSSSECCGPSCCGGTEKNAVKEEKLTADAVRDAVRTGYASIAERGSWSAAQEAKRAPLSGCVTGASGGGCCGPTNFTSEDVARAIGYSSSELATAPESANMGLSCGNPTALASLKSGEVVLDLGSGGGFDCFIAGAKVGASGKAIGVDMTAEMIKKARGNVAAYVAQIGFNNIEFRLGEIENIPAADASVDVVISNCVLNLSPDQARVWNEIARVLRSGGRVAVADLVLLKPLPMSVKQDVEALVGCIAGALLIKEVESQALKAGLVDVRIERKSGYVDAMIDWQDPLYKAIIGKLPAGDRIGDYVTSVDISAKKA